MAFTFDWGRWGVAFFFVLSGFIIYHVHQNDFGRPARAAHFAWRRLVRIFPTYWLVLFGSLCVRQYLGNPDYSINVTTTFLTKQIFLLPGGRLFINPAWTLRHELLFYGMFCISILNRSLGIAALVAWLAIILTFLPIVGLVENIDRPAMDTLTSHLNLYFFFGMAIAAAVRARKVLSALAISSALSVLLCVVDFLYPSVYAMAAAQLLASTSVVCLAAYFSERRIKAPILSGPFGAISYPLYLVHITCYLIAHGIIRRTGPFLIEGWIAEFTLAIALSFFAAFCLETMWNQFSSSAPIKWIGNALAQA